MENVFFLESIFLLNQEEVKLWPVCCVICVQCTLLHTPCGDFLSLLKTSRPDMHARQSRIIVDSLACSTATIQLPVELWEIFCIIPKPELYNIIAISPFYSPFSLKRWLLLLLLSKAWRWSHKCYTILL